MYIVVPHLRKILILALIADPIVARRWRLVHQAILQFPLIIIHSPLTLALVHQAILHPTLYLTLLLSFSDCLEFVHRSNPPQCSVLLSRSCPSGVAVPLFSISYIV
jgi:hypothetical protein